MFLYRLDCYNLRMISIPSTTSTTPEESLEISLSLMKENLPDMVGFLSPFGGIKYISKSRFPEHGCISQVTKGHTSHDPTRFFENPCNCRRTARRLLSLVRLSEEQIPLYFVLGERIAFFLHCTARNMAMRGVRQARAVMVVRVVGSTTWNHIEELPLPEVRATAESLALVAEMDEAENVHGCCAICYEELAEDGVRPPCGHEYHRGCIALWLDSHHNCPLCRCTLGASSSNSTEEQNGDDDDEGW